jgi:hypothetical protein
MSNKVLTAVFDHSKSKNATRLVLLSLADRANDAGHCWCGINDIASRANLSRAKVFAAINEAEQIGELVRRSRGGQKFCNAYTVQIQDRPDSGPSRIETETVQSLDCTRPKSGPKPSLTQRNRTCSSKDERARDCDFEKFWSAYPRKVSKASALTAWKRAKDKGTLPAIDDLLCILDCHKASDAWAKDNERFIPYPESWIKRERWNDEVSKKRQKGTRL